MDPRQLGRLAVLVHCVDLRGLWQKGAHDGLAAFLVQAKIVEGIGMAAFDDRIGLGG